MSSAFSYWFVGVAEEGTTPKNQSEEPEDI